MQGCELNRVHLHFCQITLALNGEGAQRGPHRKKEGMGEVSIASELALGPGGLGRRTDFSPLGHGT